MTTMQIKNKLNTIYHHLQIEYIKLIITESNSVKFVSLNSL